MIPATIMVVCGTILGLAIICFILIVRKDKKETAAFKERVRLEILKKEKEVEDEVIAHPDDFALHIALLDNLNRLRELYKSL